MDDLSHVTFFLSNSDPIFFQFVSLSSSLHDFLGILSKNTLEGK